MAGALKLPRLRRYIRARILVAGALLGFALAAPAQNLVITNARIIDGTGNVIERGSVVAKDGKIVSEQFFM